MSEHAECSPSQLKRVILCPASRRMVKEYKAKSSSVYADEGTMLHGVTTYELTKLYRPDLHVEGSIGIALTTEQKGCINDCLEYVESLMRELKLVSEVKSIEFETFTTLNHLSLPECSGTSDVIIRSTNRVDVIDWKFGAGIPVYVEENTQLMAYALGALNEEHKVVLHIVQPRLDYATSWSTNKDYLMYWYGDVLRPAILESRNTDASFNPGIDQCRWCVGPICKARADNIHNMAKDIFKKYIEPECTTVPVAELMPLLDKIDEINAFAKDLRAEALKAAMSPEGLIGYKVVEGRSLRNWVDEDAARTWLMDKTESGEAPFSFEDLFKTTFQSVAQIEKLDKNLKKDDEFNKLWAKSTGNPVLVPDNDRRPAMNKLSAKEVFSKYVEVK